MDQSLLGALPAELRANIFALALDEHGPVNIADVDLALSFTCHQIRGKCLLMHYDFNRRMMFRILSCNHYPIDQKLELIASLGKLQYLERLTIEVECGDYRAPRADDIGLRSQETCGQVANMLAHRVELSYEQVVGVCVDGPYRRGTWSLTRSMFRQRWQVFEAMVEGLRDVWKTITDAASKF